MLRSGDEASTVTTRCPARDLNLVGARSQHHPARMHSMTTHADVAPTSEGASTEVVTCQSRWVFDLGRRRYLRCDRNLDIDAATQFGSWRPFDHVTVTDTQLEVHEPGLPVLRAQIHGDPCACEGAASGDRYGDR
jgi:hypothetical protein